MFEFDAKMLKKAQLTLEQIKNGHHRIIVYLRVSTQMQKESGIGIETQNERTLEWIKKEFPNSEIVAVYKDEGESADKLPLFQRTYGRKLGAWSENYIKSKNGKKIPKDQEIFDLIVVYDQNRLFRDLHDEENSLKHFTFHQIKVVSYMDKKLLNFNHASDEMIRQVKGAVNQFLVRDMSLKATEQYESKKSKGMYAGGGLPYGVRWDKENKKIVEIKEQIENCMLIFNLYINEGLGMKRIARYLNDKEIPFVDNHRKKKSKWTDNNVRSVLNEPLLCGYLKYKDYIEIYDEENNIIVKKLRDKKDMSNIKRNYDLKEYFPLEVWFNMLDQMAKKAPNNRGKNNNPKTYMLTGIIKCPCCNGKMKGQNKGKKKDGSPRIYYICEDVNCIGVPVKSLDRFEMDKEFIKKFKELLKWEENDIEEIIKRLIEKIDKEENNPFLNNNEDEKILSDIVKLENAILRLNEQYEEALIEGNDDFNFVTFTTASKSLNEKLKVAKEKLKNIEDAKDEKNAIEKSIFKAKEVIEYLSDVLDNYSDYDNEIFKKLVKLLVKEVVTSNGKLEIVSVFEDENYLNNINDDKEEDELKEQFNEVINGFNEVGVSLDFLGGQSKHRHMLSLSTPTDYLALNILISHQL